MINMEEDYRYAKIDLPKVIITLAWRIQAHLFLRTIT